jgi:phage N-6-adenine-methyltransferase
LLAYVGRQPGTPVRPSDAWRTPQIYIDSARGVMGTIDLDPFSSPEANVFVGARYFFTPEQSALGRRWCPPARRRHFPAGLNVFMNPPYGSQMIPAVTHAFTTAWHQGDIQQAVVLLNNATETLWFRRLRALASAACFPTGRIAFVAEDGTASSGNTRGQVFLYMGGWPTRFREEFAPYGWTITKEGGWQ